MEHAVRSDLELETELDHLIDRLDEIDLESEEEWEAPATVPCPPPTRLTVSGFSRYGDTLAALPASEQQKVRQVAAAILASQRTGYTPVRQVDLVGHADRDFQRGPAFERKISIRRALALQRALQDLIRNSAVSSRIVWQARGAGARNLVVSNPRNEPERSRNRRVDIALSASISANYPVLVK